MKHKIEDDIDKLIDDIRKGRITRFGGGTSVFDFALDRIGAVNRVKEFLEKINA